MMENSLAKKYRDESVANQESEARENECSVPSAKKPRTSEDFYLFCKFILEYENYGLTKEEEVLEKQVNPHDSSDLPNGGNRILSSHSDQDTSSKEQNNIELKGNPNLAVPTPHDILSVTVKSPSTEDEFEVEESSDEDSYDLVTCFCKKPFAGRPMIECSKCLTWIHLSCAKVRKSHIPDVYICPSCKEDSSL